jgi:hypothetical protein
LPVEIRTSTILTGNDLGQLANVSSIPVVDNTFVYVPKLDVHTDAKNLLAEGKVDEAWQVLLRNK